MLLYNVSELSSSTPKCPARGVAVPGINTRVTNDRKQPSISFNEWPLTPQSTKEPLSDMSRSGTSSIDWYSQPATLVNNISGSTECRTPWCRDAEALPLPNFTTGMETYTVEHMPQPMPSFAFPYTMSAVSGPRDLSNDLPFCSQPDQTNTFGLPTTMCSNWAQSQRCLYGSNLHNGSFTPHQENPPVALEACSFSEYDAAPASNTCYDVPQVVVPSEDGAHEHYSMEQYPKYDHQYEVHNGFGQSFDSSTTGYSSGLDHVNSLSSPFNEYFARSEDDGDLLMVNQTASIIPPRLAHYQGQSQPTSRARPQTNHREGKAWYKCEAANITVLYSGPRFRIANDGMHVIAEGAKDPKPHKCLHLEADGSRCPAKFPRSEHLKRHRSKHDPNPAKRFACPLPNCTLKSPMSRSDNAAQHLQTHLRQKKKGKRNMFYGWEKVKELILKNFEEKTASRMVGSLTRWLNKQMCSEEYTHMTLMEWHRMMERLDFQGSA